MKITVPESLSEITIGQYLKLQRISKEESPDENFSDFAIVTIFCNLTVAQAKLIPQKEIRETAEHIKEVLKQEPRFIKNFIHEKVRYGFIPNLDEMTAGEYIDLDKYFSDESMVLNAMAVMYRPITKKIGNSYIIEDYESSTKYLKVMENVSLEVLLGVQVFFYNLSRELLKATASYLRNQKPEEIFQGADSQKSGDGIRAYIRLLEGVYLNSKKLHA